jgi:hypothetical protein
VSTPARKPDAPRRRRTKRTVVSGLLGVGLDGKDGHTRITKGPHFVLFGGSSETHERMQEFAVKLGERMKARGKEFGAVTPKELRDLAEGLPE